MTARLREAILSTMKTTPVILAALVLICVAGLTSVIHAAGRSDAPPPPKEGTVVYFEGDVTVDGAPAEIGRKLSGRASIVTGEASLCEIAFGGRNVVRVSQNSRATIHLSLAVPELALEKGGAASVLRKLDKITNTNSFQVKTKTAVAGVRGTLFCVWTDGSETYICACNGSVRTIDAKGGNEFTLRANHHVAKTYRPAGDQFSVEDTGMMRHDDATLETLAARIGEKVDWTKLEE